MHRALLLTVIACVTFTSVACGDETAEPEADTHPVIVTVTVLGDRDPTGTPVWASATDIREVEKVGVRWEGPDDESTTGDDCDAALENAKIRRESGDTHGPCETIVVNQAVTLHRAEAVVGADGIATLHLRPELAYEIWSTHDTGTGCDLSGALGEIRPGTTEVILHLDIDGCDN